MDKYDAPTKMYAIVPNLTRERSTKLAREAAARARQLAPKGYHSKIGKKILPYSGPGFYGIRWVENYIWFQEHGIKAFTMTALQGKTIPMWIKDPTGSERRKNPKAKTRVTTSGVTEVLIFRKVAMKGQRKQVKTRKGLRDVPASFPGAPGRIANRVARHPYTQPGKAAGTISSMGQDRSVSKNVGVRWRHPGLIGRHFLAEGIKFAASNNKVVVTQIVAEHPSGQLEVVT